MTGWHLLNCEQKMVLEGIMICVLCIACSWLALEVRRLGRKP
jgi:hypothetical protein